MTRSEAITAANERALRLGVDYVVVAVPNEQLGYIRHAAIRVSSWNDLANFFPECREVYRVSSLDIQARLTA